MIKETNDIISAKNNLDFENFEYMTSILKENCKNLFFLGNKRNHNENNKFTIPQNQNYFEYLNNNNLFQENIKNKKFLLEINNLKKKNNIIDKNKNNIEYNGKIFIIKKIRNKKINENENKDIYFPLKGFVQDKNINLSDKDILNNEKEVKKYNKTVYVNKYLLNNNNSYIKINRIAKVKRSSKYRGVSKNGSGWQVLMMTNNKKPYIGTYNSEELAARIYDIAAIKKIGIKSKTNFIYKNEQINRILNTNINFKSPNISKVVLELIL